MRRSFGSLLCLTLSSAALVSEARGQTIYDAKGAVYSHDLASPLLDDVRVGPPGATGPTTVRRVGFGFVNETDTDESVDVLITFYQAVDPSAAGSDAAASVPIRTYRHFVGTVLGNPTGPILRDPITLPDGGVTIAGTSVGVSFDYVLHDTNTPSVVTPLLQNMLPTVGSTVDRYWADDDRDGTFRGSEAVNVDPNFPH